MSSDHSSAQNPAPGSPQEGAEPSGFQGDTPKPAAPGHDAKPVAVQSNTPENAEGRLNPSAPEDSNATPGSTGDK